MAEESPPNPTSPAAVQGQMQIIPKKVILRPEDPRFFVNAAEFSGNGMDIFMDLGVITPESAAEAAKLYKEHPGAPVPVDFAVSFRFGLTVQTAILLHQRLALLLQQAAVVSDSMLASMSDLKEGIR
jgi:hypothetical protein